MVKNQSVAYSRCMPQVDWITCYKTLQGQMFPYFRLTVTNDEVVTRKRPAPLPVETVSSCFLFSPPKARDVYVAVGREGTKHAMKQECQPTLKSGVSGYDK